MINARKERHGSVEIADPDLGGAGIKVESAFLLDLGWGVRWGKDFNTDLRRASEEERSLQEFWPATIEPGEVHCFDAIGGGKRAFGQSTTLREKRFQKIGDMALAVSVGESWRWTHDDMSMSICLDPIREFGEARIGQDFAPPSEIKRRLGFEIWKLDGDGHGGKIRQK